MPESVSIKSFLVPNWTCDFRTEPVLELSKPLLHAFRRLELNVSVASQLARTFWPSRDFEAELLVPVASWLGSICGCNWTRLTQPRPSKS